MGLECYELHFVGINLKAVPHEPVSDDVEAVSTLLKHCLVGCASGDDGAIINIGREGFEAPGFGKMEKGEDVQSRQDGQEGRALWGAMIQDNLG